MKKPNRYLLETTSIFVGALVSLVPLANEAQAQTANKEADPELGAAVFVLPAEVGSSQAPDISTSETVDAAIANDHFYQEPALLRITAKRRTGADAAPMQSHVVASALTAENAWNSQAELSFRPFAQDPDQFQINAGLGSLRRPILFGQRQRNGVGEPEQWQELESWVTEVKIAPKGLGIAYSAGAAGTRYRLTHATRFQSANSLLLGEQPWAAGSAQWHRFKSSTAVGKAGKIELTGMLATRSDEFRDAAIAVEQSPIFAGQTHELGVRWIGQGLEVSAQSWAVDGNEIDVRESTARLRAHGVEAKWSKSDWDAYIAWSDNPEDRLAFNQRQSELSLELSLDKLIDGLAAHALLPDHMFVRYSKTDSVDAFGGALPVSSALTRQELFLTWQNEFSRTEVGLERQQYRSSSGPPTASDFGLGTGLSVNHITWGKSWDASFYVQHDSFSGGIEASKAWSVGATFSLNKDHLPKLNLGADLNSYDHFSVLDRYQDRGLELRATVDFSRQLKRLGMGQGHNLQLRGFTSYRATQVRDLATFRELGPTVMISYSSKF